MWQSLFYPYLLLIKISHHPLSQVEARKEYDLNFHKNKLPHAWGSLDEVYYPMARQR